MTAFDCPRCCRRIEVASTARASAVDADISVEVTCDECGSKTWVEFPRNEEQRLHGRGARQALETLAGPPIAKPTFVSNPQLMMDYRDLRQELEGFESANVAETEGRLLHLKVALYILVGAFLPCLDAFQRATAEDGGVRMRTMLLVQKAGEDLLAAWTEIERGAYGAANTLTRAAYESWLTLRFFEAHPEEGDRWWMGRINDLPDRDLDVGRLKRRLLDEGRLPPLEAEAYAQLSELSHPSAESSMLYLRKLDPLTPGRRLEIRRVGRFDDRLCTLLSKRALLIAARVLWLLSRLPGVAGEGRYLVPGWDLSMRRILDEIGCSDSALLASGSELSGIARVPLRDGTR